MGTSARDRKRKQRKQAKESGKMRVEITLPCSVLEPLRGILGPFKGDLAHECEAIIRIEVGRHIDRLREITRRAGPLWLASERLRPFARHLDRPGVVFRVHDRTYNSDEWLQVQNDLGQLVGALANLGWPPKRITRFLRYAGNSLKKNEAIPCPATAKTSSRPPPMTLKG